MLLSWCGVYNASGGLSLWLQGVVVCQKIKLWTNCHIFSQYKRGLGSRGVKMFYHIDSVQADRYHGLMLSPTAKLAF